MRGQTNLAALAVALVVLTGATVAGVALADAALAGADRDPVDRHAANAVAARLIAAESPVTVRANALNESTIESLNASRLDELAPATTDDVRVALDGRPVVERGTPDGGATVRRAVLVVDRSAPIRTAANLTRRSELTVPRGVDRVTVSVEPGPNTTVHTVRADGRVVLHDEAGLDTTATVAVSEYTPTTLRVATSANATGRFEVRYRRQITEERTLTVTADA